MAKAIKPRMAAPAAVAVAVVLAGCQAYALDFSLPNPFRIADLPDSASDEIQEEEWISEVLAKDANYRDLFQTVTNPDIPLRRYVQPGEELRYQAKWRGLPAGTIRLAAKRLGVVKGRQVFVFELNAESNDFMNAFYPVNTSANSYVDAATGRSYLIRRRVAERNRNYKDRLEFKYDFRMPNGLPDPVCRYSIVSDHGQEVASAPCPIPGNMQDMVSVIYYLRGLDLGKPGDSCRLLIGGRMKPAIMTLNVVGEEIVAIPKLGRFECLVIDPQGDGTNLSSNLVAARGSERFWIEKTSRIPLMFCADLPKPLGTVVATLVAAENSVLPRYALPDAEKDGP